MSNTMNVQKRKQAVRNLQVTQGLTVAVTPNPTHNFIMTTSEVAHGYDCSTVTIRQTLRRNPDEFIEGKHFVKGVTICNTLDGANNEKGGTICPTIAGQNAQPHQTYFTKRGIVRLGFFLKCGNAKLFRDWAEDIILKRTLSYSPIAELHEHEKPLFDILETYLIVGDIVGIAKELNYGRGYVSRVRNGRARSKKIMNALIARANYNKANGFSKGYDVKFVQQTLDLFNTSQMQS